MIYRFGDFRLDTATGLLQGPDGAPLVLRRQAYRLLRLLVERAPELIVRDELLDQVWGRQALSPNALPQTISELRQALGDEARQPRYIETRHGQGYRLCATVERMDAPLDAPVPGPAPRRRPVLPALAAMLLLAALASALMFGLRSPPPAPPAPAGLESLRLQVEAARQQRDLPQLAAQLRALSVLLPEDHELRMELAETELAALQGDAARRSMDLLRVQPIDREAPRWLLLEARMAEASGELQRAEEWLAAARAQALSLGDAQALLAIARQRAQLAQSRGELTEAEQRLRSDLQQTLLREHQAAQFELGLMLHINLREQGRHGEARELLAGLEERAPGLREQQRLQVEHALLQGLDGAAESAWQRLDLLQQQLVGDSDADLRIALDTAVGIIGVEVGEFATALQAFERALDTARRSGSGQRVAATQINAGAMLARRDRFAEAKRLWNEALAVFETLGDRRGIAVSLGNLAAAASAQTQNARSMELNRRALALFRELDLPAEQARTAFNIALVASREGDMPQALALLADSRRAYAAAGRTELQAHVAAVEADHLLLAGDEGAAEALLDELEPVMDDISALRRAALHASRARLAIARQQDETARAEFELARRLRAQSGQDIWVTSSDLELLQLDLMAGIEPLQARVRALELAELFRSRTQLRAALRAELLAAEALLTLGQPERAATELLRLRESAATAADMAIKLDLDWAEAFTIADAAERRLRLQALQHRAQTMGFVSLAMRCAAWLEPLGDGRARLPAYARAQPPG